MSANIYKGTRYFYGQPIGILMLDATIPRFPGDIGNAYTFDFPVRYKVVKGLTGDNVILNPDKSKLDIFIEAAKELEEEGVKAITTSCGYLALFQEELAAELHIPVFTSSLIQAPMVRRMIRPDQKVALFVADSRTITDEHLQKAGIDFPVIIKGSEDYPVFYNIYPSDIDDKVDYDECEKQLIQMAKDLKEEHPEAGAIVCEGSNFAIFRSAIQAATGIPFFDIVTLTRMIYQNVVPVGNPRGMMDDYLIMPR